MSGEMTEEEKPEEQPEENEPKLAIGLEPADEVMFNTLVENFSEDLIIADLQEVVKERVRQLYDSREQVARQLAQADQQTELGR